MKRIIEDTVYYSVFCPKYDSEQAWLDLLSDVRQAFFETGKKQKNKVIKNVFGKMYRYSYILEDAKPIKWKKMFENKLLEKSQINLDGSYNVLFFNEDKTILKSMLFGKDHTLKKVEYFSKRYRNKPVMTFFIKKDKVFTIEYDIELNQSKTYELYPIRIDVQNYKLEAFDNRLMTLLCRTNLGEITYCTKEQISEIEKLKKSKNLNEQTQIDKNVNIDIEAQKKEERSIAMKKSKEFYVGEKNQCDGYSAICGIRNRVCPYDKSGYRKTIVAENGKKFFYFGDMQNENRHGYGRTISEEGATMYVGEYANDKKEGFGIFNDKDGDLAYAG